MEPSASSRLRRQQNASEIDPGLILPCRERPLVFGKLKTGRRSELERDRRLGRDVGRLRRTHPREPTVSAAHRRALALAALPLALGCRSVDHMRSLPMDLGSEARYAVAAPEVHSALPAALDQVGASASVDEPLDSRTRIVVASRSSTLFSNGDISRVLVGPDSVGGTEVRVLSRSQYLLDMSGRADRTAPRILAALDEVLGPGAVVPFPGLRVRGSSADGTPLSGTIWSNGGGSWSLAVSEPAGAREVPLSELTDPAVLRGTYNHRAEGSLIGSLLGLGVGLAIAAGRSDSSFDGYDQLWVDLWLGAGVGSLVGMVVGSTIRTEVWSPMAPVPQAVGGGRSFDGTAPGYAGAAPFRWRERR